MITNTPSHRDMTPEVRQKVTQWIVQSAFGLIGFGLLLFLSAGRPDWLWGWALVVVLAAFLAAHPLILIPINPELLAERQKGLRDPQIKAWDRWVAALGGGLFPFAAMLIAGLDERFGWTASFPLPLHLAGLATSALGYGLFLWAMASNAFFSEGVRIQEERGHTVATGGPYRYVRHPGYTGAILSLAATPFLLGSLWAMLPGVIAAGLYVLRTYLEDRMLINELPGYDAYTRRTRFRLVPGIW